MGPAIGRGNREPDLACRLWPRDSPPHSPTATLHALTWDRFFLWLCENGEIRVQVGLQGAGQHSAGGGGGWAWGGACFEISAGLPPVSGLRVYSRRVAQTQNNLKPERLTLGMYRGLDGAPGGYAVQLQVYGQSLHHKPQTRTPRPETRHPTSQPPTSKPQTPERKAGRRVTPSGKEVIKETGAHKCAIHYVPTPETRNPKPETRNPKPGTRNPKPETRNSKTETRDTLRPVSHKIILAGLFHWSSYSKRGSYLFLVPFQIVFHAYS